MSPISLWLADYQLLAAALLLGVMLAIAALRQPAQRLAVAKSTLAALAALAILCALPGWSLVHLLSDDAPIVEPAPSRTEPTPAFSSTLSTIEPAPDLFHAQPPESPAGAVLHTNSMDEVEPASPISWSTYLITAYAAGSAAVTLWLITGALLAHRVRRQATPAPPELQALLQQLCGNEKRAPQLLISPHITAPVALGLRRPTILLPPSALPLPPSQLLPILAHELAHLQHRDLHTLAATRLLLALLWPQPLYWLLRRTIRLDQETLADAAAADRAGRLDYAQQLLAWASSAGAQRPPRLAGAVGLWEGPSQLKRRIAVLLNEQFSVMRSCSRRWKALSVGCIISLATMLSLVTLQPALSAPENDDQTTSVQQTEQNEDNADKAPEQEQAVRMQALVKQLTREPNVFMGYCIDEVGQPLADVDVSLFIYQGATANENVEPIASVRTGADGKFEFNKPVGVAEEFPNGVPEDYFATPPVKIIAAVAKSPGFTTEFQNEALYQFVKRGQAAILQMKPAQKLTGRMTDDEGQPVANAIVTTTLNAGGFVPSSNLSVRTDAEGRYTIDDLPSFDAAERDREYAAARERKEPWAMMRPPGPALSVQHPDYAAHRVSLEAIPGEVNVTLLPGVTIKGRVVAKSSPTSDNVRPLANVPVWITRTTVPIVDPRASYALVEQQQAMTDAEGNYSFASLPAGGYSLTATAPDLTTVGVTGVEGDGGQTTLAADVVLTPGAIVHTKLLDAATKQPLKLRAGQKGYVIPKLLTPGALRNDSTIATFTADGVGETRLAPGRYELFVSIPGEGLAPNLESHSPDGKSTVGEFEVREGETLELDVPLIAFPLQQASGITAIVAPAVSDGAAVETQAPPLPATGHFQPLMSPAEGDQPSPVPLNADPSGERDIPIEGGAYDSSPNSKADPPPALSSAEAFTISGRCIDEAGNPVPNARLWLPLRPEFLDYAATLEAVADGAGKFMFTIPSKLREPSPRLQFSRIYAYEPTYAVGIASAYKQLNLSDLSAVEVTLPAAAATTYRVFDPAGDPVANARVEPWHLPAGDIYPESLRELLQNESDDRGQVTLQSIREGDIRSVRVQHADWGEQEFSELNNRRVGGNDELRLSLVGGIRGRVVSEGDGPVAGIPVYAITRQEFSRAEGDAEGYATTFTDAEGRFEMPVIAAGSGPINFYVNQNQPWRVRAFGGIVVKPDELSELNVSLEKAVRVSGKVQTADAQQPVPAAQVHIRHGDLTKNWMTEQTITDEAGHFEAFVLPGEIRMYIQQKPAEFDPWECTEERRKTPIIVSDDSNTFDLPPIELERTKAVEGVVVDHNDQPLAKVQLYGTASNYIYGNTSSDEKGRFVMQLPTSITIEEYVIRTNDSRDRHVLEVVSESPMKLRMPAPGVRQDVGAPTESNDSEQATDNQDASKASDPRTPFWTVPASTDVELTVAVVPPTKADGILIDSGAPENKTWRLLPESALKVGNPATLQEAVK